MLRKILLSTIFIFILLTSISLLVLSTVGYETNKFNNFISKKINEKNKLISIDFDTIRFKFEMRSLSLFIETDNPAIEFQDTSIPVANIKAYLKFTSIIISKPQIDKIRILSKEIDIDQMKKLIIKVKPNNLNSFIINKIKNGKIITNLDIYFNDDLSIENYIVKGDVKEMQAVLKDNLVVKKTKFNFFFDKSDIILKEIDTELAGINIKDGTIRINRDDLVDLKSDFKIEIDINKENFDKYLPYVENLKIFNDDTILIAKINQSLDITFDKTYKIINRDYNSNGVIEKFFLKFNQPVSINYLTKDIESLLFSNSNLQYSQSLNKEHKINSLGKYEINNDGKQNFEISSTFFNDLLNVDTNFEFRPEFNFDLINYAKNKDVNANISTNFTFKKDRLNFKKIKIEENKNEIIVENLKIFKEKLASFRKISVKTFKEKKLNNDFQISFNKNINLNGKKFDAEKLNKFINKKSDQNYLSNINKDIEINIKNIVTPLSKQLNNFRLIGTFEKGKFVKITSKGEFDENQFLDISLKSDKKNEKKYLEVYSDLPKPLLTEYKFFDGLVGGTLLFSSVIEKDLSTSKLMIENFKLINAPAVVKLLSLADFGGLADLAEGEGLSFEKLEISMSSKDKFLKLNELFAVGPSISVLMEGYNDANGVTSLRGTLVPAKNLNKLLSKIPVIGDIIIPKDLGEGLFGVSFKMKGPPGKIKTTINPIKTLTPRFITKALKKSKDTK